MRAEERIPGGGLSPTKFWMVATRNREQVVSRCWSDIQPRSSSHIASWDPARVLAECDAKRQLVAKHPTRGSHDCNPWSGGACETLQLLALPYADRPGYREEWRP